MILNNNNNYNDYGTNKLINFLQFFEKYQHLGQINQRNQIQAIPSGNKSYKESQNHIMQLQSIQNMNPLQITKSLYAKYSSSQTYYYSNVAAQIIKQKRTAINITYQDTQYLCDVQQYLKRFYQHHQFPGKMFTFKQYYFYHQDCPRIFVKHIQELYSKWQDRRRDLIYKKLKILYNQSFTTSRSSSKQQDNKSASGITHFLLQISDYNPFSKKYYLRVQAKKQQEKQKQKQIKNKTVKDLSSLNHELSLMLNDISQLSMISTFQQQQSPKFSSLYHSKKLKVNYSSEYSTHHNSQSNSNIQSNVKFNFKKSKNSTRQKQKLIDQFNKKLEIKNKSQQKMIINPPSRTSPKYAQKQLLQPFSKSKSIFQLSAFSSNKKSQIIINLNSNKKQQLKITTEKKPPSRQNRISLQNKALKRYESQKKVIIQTKSNKKMTGLQTPGIQRMTFQSISNKNSSSNFNLKPIQRYNSDKNDALAGYIQKPNNQASQFKRASQFSDNKIHITDQVRFRSHKSQYSSLPKYNGVATHLNSPAKVSFNITRQKKNSKKQRFQIHIGKKSDLKIQ